MKEDCLVEGCDRDTPLTLSFVPFQLTIPQNAYFIGFASEKYLGNMNLYRLVGRTHDFKTLGPDYRDVRWVVPKKGWTIEDERIRWMFDGIRSFGFTDGRLFVKRTYLEDPQWKWYLDMGLEQILASIEKLKSGEFKQ